MQKIEYKKWKLMNYKSKAIITVLLFFSINSFAQLQSEDILFTLNDKQNFIIDDYYLYSENGKYSIEDEVSKQNLFSFFFKYKKSIIGRYTYTQDDNNNLTCELYTTNKTTQKILNLKKGVKLINLKKNKFEKK